MRVFSACPRCDNELPEGARACSCGWRAKGEPAASAGPTMCCWNDHGIDCKHRGIMSPSTNGSGPWYCREHWYELRGYPDMKAGGLHGNELPKTPLHSFAVDNVRKRLKSSPHREPGEEG